MEYSELSEIVTELPIFGSFSVSFSKDSYEELKKVLANLFYTEKIRIKCVECGEYCPFTVSHSIAKYGATGKYKYGANYGWSFNDLDSSELFRYSILFPEFDEGIIEYTFRCSMDSLHYQKMYLLYILSKGTITFRKIGQKPLNVDLKEKMSNEYKNILTKYDSFDDFRYFEQSESRNLLAGSCTYLRRILEKMVNKMFGEYKKTNNVVEEPKHFEDKFSLVKNQFEESIREIVKNSYSLLSKGIHELSNEEIKEFYILMLQVICVQLEYEKEIDETAKKRKTLKKKIDLAISKFSEK